MWSLSRSTVGKTELSQKLKLSFYRSVFVLVLSCSRELWVVTERTRSRLQTAEGDFRDRVRSSVTWRELGVELLLLHIKKNQLRCPPWEAVSGMTHWAEVLGKIQDTLERLSEAFN